MAFARQNRLPAQALRDRFQVVAHGPHIKILFRATQNPHWRAAVRIPARITKNAVERNRVRRTLSEVVGVLFQEQGRAGVDVIISVHAAGSPEVLRSECAALFERL